MVASQLLTASRVETRLLYALTWPEEARKQHEEMGFHEGWGALNRNADAKGRRHVYGAHHQ
jgi:uncharacterized protein YndB with AHSA1/START domain